MFPLIKPLFSTAVIVMVMVIRTNPMVVRVFGTEDFGLEPLLTFPTLRRGWLEVDNENI